MSITSNTISDFHLKTSSGVTISDRVCCLDAITASWSVLASTLTCSDNSDVGFIELTSASCTNRCTLARGTSDHTFCFCPYNNTGTSEQYTLNFHRQCSDQSDNFSIALTRFKTTVSAGSDRMISFGETASLGNSLSDAAYTQYQWSSNDATDIISNSGQLAATVRPCSPGAHTYTITAQDRQFPNCSDVDSVTITVKQPIILWSDVQQSDGDSTCTLSGTLIASDTYTNQFHVTLNNVSIGSDIFNSDISTPYSFSQTIQKPTTPSTVQYRLTATLSGYSDCSNAIITSDFFCTRPYVTLPGGPSSLEMFIRWFGFLFVFIFFGFAFYDL